MNYKEFTHHFGVEIEGYTALPRTRFIREVVEITGFEFGYKAWQRASNAENFWTLTTDGSVKSPHRLKGDEIVSPILKGESGIKDLQVMLKAIRNKKVLGADNIFKVNKTCGVHVHINISNYDGNQIRRIFYMYQHLEPELHKMFPESRRKTPEEGKNYCKSIAGYNFDDFLEDERVKYHAVTFPPAIPTIEFRIHNGSTNYKKISNWLRILDYIIRYALDNPCMSKIEEGTKKLYLSDILPQTLMEYYQTRALKFST